MSPWIQLCFIVLVQTRHREVPIGQVCIRLGIFKQEFLWRRETSSHRNCALDQLTSSLVLVTSLSTNHFFYPRSCSSQSYIISCLGTIAIWFNQSYSTIKVMWLERQREGSLTSLSIVHAIEDLVEDVERPLIRGLAHRPGLLQKVWESSSQGDTLAVVPRATVHWSQCLLNGSVRHLHRYTKTSACFMFQSSATETVGIYHMGTKPWPHEELASS